MNDEPKLPADPDLDEEFVEVDQLGGDADIMESLPDVGSPLVNEDMDALVREGRLERLAKDSDVPVPAP